MEKRSILEKSIGRRRAEGIKNPDDALLKGISPEELEDILLGTEFNNDLFQPPPPRPDCDICFLPIPDPGQHEMYQACCGKTLCLGCITAHILASTKDIFNCPFCRSPSVKGGEEKAIKEQIRLLKKRTKANPNDPLACHQLGLLLFKESVEAERDEDVTEALKLWHRSAQLGYPYAHYFLGLVYNEGCGVDEDEKKAIHHWRLAAIGGDLDARQILGSIAYMYTDNMEIAAKHWLLAAEHGHDESLQNVKLLYTEGHVTKEVFAKALRAHQAVNDEYKSVHRDNAAKYLAKVAKDWEARLLQTKFFSDTL